MIKSITAAVLFIVIFSSSSFSDTHFDESQPHFCIGAGGNIDIFRGGLHGRVWYKDRFGVSLKGYGDWKNSGLGGILELLIKAPIDYPLKPYLTIGGGYHFQHIDTTLNNLPFNEWIGMNTFRVAVGGEYRFGLLEQHGLSLEIGYFRGSADYSRSLSDIGNDSLYADTNTYELPPITITALYTYYFCKEKVADRDRDGIVDSLDNCKDIPEDKDGYLDEDGCPDLDNDNDGINDIDDKCPLVAEDIDGFEDSDGCPDVDNDSDGILDSVDQCPNVAEVKNGYRDDDGCADDLVMEEKKPIILHGVNFESGSDVIREESLPILDEVAKSLIAWPNTKVEIQGHTDNVGSEEFNLDLSKRRAISLGKYLVSRGVNRENLIAEGYGETRPIATNDTPEGRAENRRVELKSLNDDK